MPQRSPSLQPANESSAPVAENSYEIVGLKLAEEMPINFEGRRYDLARLTPEEAEYLLQFPGQVPYLRRKTA